MNKRLSTLLLLLCICYGAVPSTAQNINTVARIGQLLKNKNWYHREPIMPTVYNDVAVDSFGNIYITDAESHVIRKLNTSTGAYTIVAGTGVAGYSGDGSLATSAQINTPGSIRIDAENNIVFIDHYNYRIRKIDVSTGVISTICGTGVPGFLGDGGAATSARINRAYGLAFDAERNLYFSDSYNHRIRRIDNLTGNISTYAGTGMAGMGIDGDAAAATRFNMPMGLSFDRTGDLFIADYYNHKIKRIDRASRLVYTYAGANPTAGVYGDSVEALSVALNTPCYISFDKDNNLYVTEHDLSVIRKIYESTKFATRHAGRFGVSEFPRGDGQLAKSSILNHPQGIACDIKNDLVYVVDAYNFRVRVIANTPESPSGIDSIIAYCKDEKAAAIPITGSDIKWYNTSVGGTPLSGTPVINTSVSDTFVYFFTKTAAGKESMRKALVIAIKPLPPTPTVVTPVHYCYGDTTTFMLAEIEFGNQLKWYSDSDRVNRLGDYPKPSSYMKGLSKYYVAGRSPNGCEGKLAVVEVYVQRPEPPKVKSPNILCTHSGNDTLKAEGHILKWFSTDDESDTGLSRAPVIRLSDTGTYTFYVNQKDEMGCTSERAQLVTMVKARAVRPEVESPVSYCQESKASPLKAMGENLKWYNANIEYLDSVAPVPQTAKSGNFIYYVSQTNQYGCEGEVNRIEVEVLEKPYVTIGEKAYGAATALRIELQASGANEYKWSNNQTGNSISFTPMNSGKYINWVIGYSDKGCASDTIFHINDINSSFYWNGEITVFPNPVADYIFISGVDLSKVVSINIHNLQGRLIAQSAIPATSLRLDLPAGMPSGHYIVEVNTVGNANPSKIIYKP